MLLPNPDDRPSVDQLLASDLLAEEYMVMHRQDILDLKSSVQSQERIIKQQEEHIRMLEQKLVALTTCGVQSQSHTSLMQII